MSYQTKDWLSLAGALALGVAISSEPAQRFFRLTWSLISRQPMKSPKYSSSQGAKAHEYLVSVAVRGTKELQDLHKETYKKYPKLGGMASSHDAIAVHQLCAKLVHAKKVIEVGVFTGFATLGMALVLPPDGKLIACDVSEEFAQVGLPYWKAAGVDQKIDLRIAPAGDTLQALLDAGEAGTFDLAFIDADKTSYDHYYELLLKLLRSGGLLMLDNVLWPTRRMDESGKALDALNKKIHKDDRLEAICMLKNADGITLALKK